MIKKKIKSLELHEDYSRLNIHDLFDPSSTFSPGAGLWGLRGIIPIHDQSGDFVFLVNYGQHVVEYDFDEGITMGGVFTWRSQPALELASSQVRQFIKHDELSNNIYLFLRTAERDRDGSPMNYTYLGKLKYLQHDNERERPVHFQWRLIDGVPPTRVCRRIGLQLHPASFNEISASDVLSRGLIQTLPPEGFAKSGIPTGHFREAVGIDFVLQAEQNAMVGRLGEELTVEFEKAALISAGKPELAARVRHISLVLGDGAGYDVESYTNDGRRKWIEVKSTVGDAMSDFFMTQNEVAFAKQNSGSYYLYRIFGLDQKSRSGDFFVISGDLSGSFELEPISFRVRIASRNSKRF